MIDQVFAQLHTLIDKRFNLHQTASLKDEINQEIQLTKTGKSLLLKFDTQASRSKNTGSLFPFFSSIKKLNKIADYVVVYPKENVLYVFICELKSHNPNDALEQIRATHLFTDYLVKTAQRLLQFQYEGLPIEYRGLILMNGPQAKGKTKPTNLAYQEDSLTRLKYRYLKAQRQLNLDSLTH